MAAHRRSLELALRSFVFDAVSSYGITTTHATVLQYFGGADDRRKAGDGGTGSFTTVQRARG
jgi:hypothetical protein